MMDKGQMEKQLLQVLEEDNRIGIDQLAGMLGLAAAEVQAMIADLEARGIIVKYGAMVNWQKTDVEKVEALIEVKVTPQRGQGFDQIAQRIYRYPEVREVTLMSGAYDLAVTVEGRSMREVALFVAQRLAVMENVHGTATHFVLKRYKVDGVILDEETPDRRLVVSP